MIKVAVTGANGYIGKEFIKMASDTPKIELIALSRDHIDIEDVQWRHYDLSMDQLNLPDSLDIIVHLASSTTSHDLSSDIEIFATKMLLLEAKKSNANFIFVSSQTAAEQGSRYARSKWQIEQLVRDYGGIILRPGLVYGGPLEGLYGRIVHLVSILPILPNFGNIARIQVIHIHDLCSILCRLLVDKSLNQSTIMVAESSWMSFRAFLDAIAKYRLRKKRYFISISANLIFILQRRFPHYKPLESLTSLFTLPYMSTEKSLKKLEISLRDVRDGLTSLRQNNRSLILEGVIIYRYLVGKNSSYFSVRCYVRAIKTLKNNTLLNVPLLVKLFPSMLGAYEYAERFERMNESELIWRVSAASRLLEATVSGGKNYLDSTNQSPLLNSIAALTWISICEATYRLLGLTIFILRKLYLIPQMKLFNE